MASDTRKRLALAIIDFLNKSLKDGTLTSEDSESIEIASNCIAESFKVDPTDTAAVSNALGGGQDLLSIFSVYEKLKGTKGASGAQSSSTPSSSSTAGASAGTTPEKSAEAEALKGQGNAAYQKKDYNGAVDFYTKALTISPLNPIYLCNRAAAYSALNKHDLAKNDAELATAADPKYTKAWSRLGLARFALGDAKGSMEAYKQGIDAEGNGGSDAMKKGYETAKRRYEEEHGSAEDEEDIGSSRSPAGGAGAGGGMPDLAGLASMLGGGGGGGGGGGMPNFAEMMNNPMLRSMAQNVMQNPDMMNNILNNPRLREMADRFGGGGGGAGGAGAGGAGGAGEQGARGGGGGGGMPDLASLMNDPSIAEMARNFMGGMGGAGGAGRGAGRGA